MGSAGSAGRRAREARLRAVPRRRQRLVVSGEVPALPPGRGHEPESARVVDRRRFDVRHLPRRSSRRTRRHLRLARGRWHRPFRSRGHRLPPRRLACRRGLREVPQWTWRAIHRSRPGLRQLSSQPTPRHEVLPAHVRDLPLADGEIPQGGGRRPRRVSARQARRAQGRVRRLSYGRERSRSRRHRVRALPRDGVSSRRALQGAHVYRMPSRLDELEPECVQPFDDEIPPELPTRGATLSRLSPRQRPRRVRAPTDRHQMHWLPCTSQRARRCRASDGPLSRRSMHAMPSLSRPTDAAPHQLDRPGRTWRQRNLATLQRSQGRAVRRVPHPARPQGEDVVRPRRHQLQRPELSRGRRARRQARSEVRELSCPGHLGRAQVRSRQAVSLGLDVPAARHAPDASVRSVSCESRLRDGARRVRGLSCRGRRASGSLGTKCEQCHRDTGDVTFDHDRARFKLDGKHKAVACADCHPNGELKPRPTKCAGCHPVPAFHRNARSELAWYDDDCGGCHSARRW